jgi:aminoglycoside phosphotransferase (APT) family kinase protein
VIDVFAIVEDLARRRGADGARVSVIELNRSGASLRAVALLAFLDDRPDPIAFLKATADPARAATLEREFANLRRLARGGAETFRRSVPEPFYCEKIGGFTVLAESALSGTRMKDYPPDRYYASPGFRRHFSLAVRWLVDFHRALEDDPSLPPPVEPAREVARYRETYRVTAVLSDLLDESVRALEGDALPCPPSHGDFCAANVIPRDDGVAVIDWEYPLTRTWPLADLLYFASSTWCTPYRKGREALAANYRALFFSSHRFSDLLRAEVARYAEQLGIASDLVLPLSVLSWTAFANRKHDELARAGDALDPDGHIPLVLVENDSCLNLELLAQHRSSYLLA